MIATEIVDRAIPWMRLVKRELLRDSRGARPPRGAKNLKIALSWLAAGIGALAWVQHSVLLCCAALACATAMVVSNAGQLAFFARERNLRFAALSVPVDMLYYLIAGVGVMCGWVVRQAFGEPTPGPVAEAYAEMGRKRWPPVPVKRIARSVVASNNALPAPSPILDELLLAQEQTVVPAPIDASNIIQ
jgi:hypothetical protein